MRRVRASALKRETGMNVVQAGRILEQILDRLIPTGYGTFKKLSIRTKQELAVLMFVANRLKSGPLFTDDDLLRDLSHILQKQNLLRQSEVAALSQRKAAITIFALTTI